jgi:hypothetical protein
MGINMDKKKTKKKTVNLKKIAFHEGIITKEDLPLPYVHYPNFYGVFFGFSEGIDTVLLMCECSESAIGNYLEIISKYNSSGLISHEIRDFPKHFSPILANQNPNRVSFQFHKNLCHKCNQKTPTYAYQHIMYGSRFAQNYGWYINQKSLNFGFYRMRFLENKCPPDVIEDILLVINTTKELAEFKNLYEEYYRNLYFAGQRGNRNYDFRGMDFDNLRDLERNAERAKRALKNKMENIVREEFGYKKIGYSWTSETLLYNLVRNIYKDEVVLFHYRPEWLNGLELDIFIPSINTGIEYQGQQHHIAIDAWGGEEALLRTQSRDEQKKILCAQNYVRLIHINYFEPLTEEFVKRKLDS